MKKLFILLLPLALVCACGEIQPLGNDDKGDNTTSDYIYKVGDTYEGDKDGIVFYVTDGGRHGKIVSLDEEVTEGRAWSTEYIKTGALDFDDGMANMKAIQSISG